MPFYRFKNRRATAEEWSLSNDVLLDGELGFETDTRKFKLGDGVTPWSGIDYFLDEEDLDAAIAAFVLDVDSESREALESLLTGSGLPAGGNVGDVVTNTGPGAGGWSAPDVTQSELNAVNATATSAGSAASAASVAAAAAQSTANTHASRHANGGADEISIDGSQVTSGVVQDARIASTITRDSELNAAVTAEADLARNADNLTSGTVSDARIASTIARDSEVAAVQSNLTTHEANVSNPHSVTKAQVGLGSAENTSDANKPISNATQTALNAKADLVGGVVPSGQLPSFVDDVLEYADFASLPATGAAGKIYVTLDNNLTYRWSGSAYVEISSSLALGETSATAYRGDRGKTAFDHSQLTSGNPHAVTKADVGLGDATNTSDADKPVSTAQQAALDTKAADSAVVHNSGDETIGGTKTFSIAPVVPNDSFAIAKTTGLQAALDAKAASSHNHAAGDVNSGTMATARLGSGTANGLTFLRGDQSWAVPSTTPTTVLTTDWNAITDPGFYKSNPGASNAPSGGGEGWSGVAVTTQAGGFFQIVGRSEASAIAPQLWYRTYWNDGESDGWTAWQQVVQTKPFEMQVALSDETTDITTGLKLTVRAPCAFTLTGIRTSLTEAGSSATVIDVKESGSTVCSTKPSIDASEKTSVTGTAAVISDSAIADDAELTFHIDTAGTGAKGAKVTLIGTRV